MHGGELTGADTADTSDDGPRADLPRLRANLDDVQDRIATAARAAGRDPAELTLVAVSKTWPAADVVVLRGLGVTHFAENREQEAARKVAEVHARLGLLPAGVNGVAAGSGLAEDSVRGGDSCHAGTSAAERTIWHYVGQLQRNKANAVARWADWVQCVDRPEIVASLARAAATAGRELTVCLQVSLDTSPGGPESGPNGAPNAGRGGAAPADVPGLADLVAAAGWLRLAGVMAVAPRGQPPRPAFARLREVAEKLRQTHPDARVISAGMSGDLEAAVAEGATHLRIGTALFGERLPVP
ncbi:YggS family pyridoxal phosphate enzyme [Frankia sp. AgB1.9]|uniref:YggS family pyridoxal phosphate enzyme n=1 Tax=unclassified Frankia TaxID=2632575 RepID=UPI0019316774|nr:MULTISPECIES: YggS family pyridoxal phosphate enzyme [unclassified Frankia]MBL7490318.1 YggS family pyridoxal phosphate enzyme [Frankia sp. AgW1.1]MBL7546771.1 YggS family pyridoxal phosphate enzyme [Frankia sp. AgB1.9]MBL7623759.1 YggS family pyridoxal phosphate enzyme [Frankia sp. AgB1.8]